MPNEYNVTQPSKGIAKVSEKDIAVAQKIRSMKHFLWNPESREFLGRTGISWLKITIAYIIFYIALGLFFALCMLAFNTTLPDDRPKWILAESVIGTNPGLSMRPQSESAIITFKNVTKQVENPFSEQISKFIEHFKNSTSEEGKNNLLDCDYDGPRANESQACKWSASRSEECSKENDYGYQSPSSGPCILLKLNKIFGWKPKAFGIQDGKFSLSVLKEELDGTGMPQEMRDYIVNYSSNDTNQEASYLENVWITCKQLLSKKDNEDETVAFEYYPRREIPGYYFPFHNQIGYQTPFLLVKIKFLNPINENDKNKEHKIECTAWAKNIHPDKFTKAGMSRFRIQT